MHWLYYRPQLWVLWLHEGKGWYPKEMKLSYLNPSFREFGVWDCFFWVKGEQASQKTFNCHLSESSGRTYSSPEKNWRVAFTVSRILHEINFFLVVVKFWETWNVWIFLYMRLMSLNLRLIFTTDTFLVLLRETIRTHSKKSTLLSRFAKQLSCMFIILLW